MTSTDAEPVTTAARRGRAAGNAASILAALRRPRPVPRVPRKFREDRAALALWLLTRPAMMLVVGSAGWILAADGATRPAGFLDTWDHWDFKHFRTIGEYGYQGNPKSGPPVPLEAFFPGFPYTLKAVHLLVGDWVVAGLLISFVCGGVAVVLLSRVAGLENPAGVGERAVLLLLLSPPAVFLAAGYTEALFLMLALASWLCAKRGAWHWAGLLAAGALCVRVSGAFLLAALAVEFLTATDGRRRWRDAPWLAVGALPGLVYMCFLYRRTGDWTAWNSAQITGWDRHLVGPVDAFRNTWGLAGRTGTGTILGFTWMYRWEMLAVAVGVALTAYLLRRRRWSEATYVGLTVLSLGVSSAYFSVPRATLLWWPLWIVLARLTLRHKALFTAYLALIAPFAVVFALLFGAGRWAG
ncbi:glycosyltransferase family 39 protein [Yinghuangia seranimata]|uniref:glycosyltransferase family 39 protein n=1 Tax=Yinghuangia seranimata TaxID=408067 RepID=UPI00248D1D2B|nr:glycosyltransferase family 39 protein [Yinghuangia seranimata]MDI2130462.1 glycosyltransferase family 39 protein [Yinghuangia seranimata]